MLKALPLVAVCLALCGCQLSPPMKPAPTWVAQGHADIDNSFMDDEQKREGHRILAVIARTVGDDPPPTNLGEAIGRVLGVTVPLLGPAAPWVVLGSTLLTAIGTGLEGRRRKKNAIRSIVGPQEAARRRDLEDKLRTDASVMGESFIVLDKAAMAPVHAGNGAAALIAGVTRR